MQFSITSECREHDASYESALRCKVNQALAKYSRQFRKSSMRIYRAADGVNVNCLMLLMSLKGKELRIEESAPTDSEAITKTIKAATSQAKAFVARITAASSKKPTSSVWPSL